LNLFRNKHLKPIGTAGIEIGTGRQITSMYKLTTKEAKGYSLMDNNGNKNPCNVDCILKLDLASI